MFFLNCSTKYGNENSEFQNIEPSSRKEIAAQNHPVGVGLRLSFGHTMEHAVPLSSSRKMDGCWGRWDTWRTGYTASSCCTRCSCTSSSTVCPRSLNPFYNVHYYIKWVKTSWTYSTKLGIFTRNELCFSSWKQGLLLQYFLILATVRFANFLTI